MRKPKVDPKELWLCEGCGLVTHSKDAPDICIRCYHGYHENVYDLQQEAKKVGVIH